jgi:diaminohydroxyphosphoribosylaminopyrimidine deaminase/5-amino-6-(5-phosphoribosylamino)uracil reductase
MRQAVKLARQVLGTTSPNPAVGAVVVKDGVEVGRGATQPPGQAHAEIGALEQAGDLAKGATLYVTLEPCCNWGRTPPCTKAIIDAGITKVYSAAIDPNPAVAGKGLAELESAGLQTVLDEGVDGVKELYEAFSKHIKTGLPYVTAKFAVSLDGKIATHTGDSKWVTGTAARSLVQQMRREIDGILVGVGTVLADDPLLTARDSVGSPLERQPLRAVLDSACRTPPAAQIFKQPGTTVVYTKEDAPKARTRRLEAAGAQIVRLPPDEAGHVNLPDVLADLGSRGIVSLIVEGGGTVLGSFFDRGLVDKVFVFIAPVIVGGSGAASPVEGLGVNTMRGAWRVEEVAAQRIGEDWLITGYPRRQE